MMAPWLIAAFAVINTLFRMGIGIIVVLKLLCYRAMFNSAERFGLGGMGGGFLMTIWVVWEPEGSPFQYWAGSLSSAGLFVYLCGRMSRHMKHRKGNNEMRAAGQEWRAHRGEP